MTVCPHMTPPGCCTVCEDLAAAKAILKKWLAWYERVQVWDDGGNKPPTEESTKMIKEVRPCSPTPN